MSFIKVSNKIFDYQLSPKAIYVYLYLFSCRSRLQTVNDRSLSSIAAYCGMSVRSTQSAIAELTDKSLVIKEHCVKERNFTDKNRYFVTDISTKKGWFKLDRQVFKTNITPTDFMVYCYICKHMSAKRGEAFPSLTSISNGTGISRARVAKATAFLRSFSFLNKINRRYKRTRAFRHNRYLFFVYKKTEDAPNSPRRKTSSIRTILNIVFKLYNRLSKKSSFFLKRGWYYFCQAYIRRTILALREKIYSRVFKFY